MIGTDDWSDVDMYDMLIESIETDAAFREFNNLVADYGFSAMPQEEVSAIYSEMSEYGRHVVVTMWDWINHLLNPNWDRRD